MKTVILVRHASHAEVGHVLSGRSGIALSAAGRAEADALAGTLAATTIASLHASPRRRAQETASPIAVRRGMAVRSAPALDEVDFGGFTGRAFAALDGDADWHRWNAERATARCPGGETMAQAVARAADYIAALAPEECPAVCVTHCDIIRGLVAHYLGLALDRLFAFECDPASRTTVVLGDAQVRLVALNLPAAP